MWYCTISCRIWIQAIFTEITNIFYNHRHDLKIKINALFLLRQILKTSQYLAFYFSETYIFNHFSSVADYYQKNK